MSSLLDSFIEIKQKVNEYLKQIADTESELAAINNKQNDEIPARIANLKQQLEKIDEYQLKIDGFRQLAEKHLTSKNVATIEAPPGYRVNLNRLRTWAMLIDPISQDDPYAQRVYLVAQCDSCFLAQKKQEFTARIAELEQDQTTGATEEIKALEAKISGLKDSLRQYVSGADMAKFADMVIKANDGYRYTEAPSTYEIPDSQIEFWVPGAYGLALEMEDSLKKILKGMFGIFCDEKTGRIYLPLEEMRTDREFAVTVSCVPARNRLNEMDAGIRNLIFNVIDRSPAGSRKVYVIDGVRQNSSLVGSLKPLEGSFALQTVPRTSEQIAATLEELVSSFNDIDDALENHDTVVDYNKSVEQEKQLTRALVVIVGWPNAFEGEIRDYIEKIVTNYERYGISFIIAKVSTKAGGDFGLSDYIGENIINITMTTSDTNVSIGNSGEYKFAWYTFKYGLEQAYVDSIKEHNVEKTVLGTEYVNRVDMDTMPIYERGKKSICVPYGVDSKDEVHSISFDNENFAAYLMGASGSGKSTLLHTLITGIIKNYHPDDVELWLADFKMSEFAQYITPLPPHVKYILLDESHELVYDLIDKLTEKMLERQRFFMKHRDMKKVENVPSNIYMPVIFVLLDEFSIMSQAIEESQPYRLKLQNLLAKGRALGIKFLFSSQTFMSGISGLTKTAKAQIQSRIAMKNSKEEISETLELSTNMKTDQVRNWMDVLPPHFALYKYREGDSVCIKRLQVMYFKGKGEEAFEPQRKMIHYLNQSMQAVSEEDYKPENMNTYVNKEPVIVDGNSYEAFAPKMLMERFVQKRQTADMEIAEEDTFVAFGTPRRMSNIELATFSAETRENLLLISPVTEMACGMAIMLSVMESFRLQGKDVQVWVYSKNRLYQTYKTTQWCKYDVVEGLEKICEKIHELKEKIKNKQSGNEIIVLVGIERIIADFDFVDSTGESKSAEARKAEREERDKELIKKGAVATTEEDNKKRERAAMWRKRKTEVRDRARAEGKSKEEIDKLLEEEKKIFFNAGQRDKVQEEKKPTEEPKQTVTENAAAKQQAQKSNTYKGGAYNAKADFLYVVKHGSRLGYHFLLCLSSYADLVQTSLRIDLFRYRMAFQITTDESRTLFGNKKASSLPEHICQFSDGIEQYSFRPYLHRGLSWEGWFVSDTEDIALNSFDI